MKKINLQWIFSLLIVTVLTGCGRISSFRDSGAGEEARDTSITDAVIAEEEVFPDMTPQQVMDKFIEEMIEVDKMMHSGDMDGAEERFDSACSEAVMYIDCMSEEERSDAYEYWTQITKKFSDTEFGFI